MSFGTLFSPKRRPDRRTIAPHWIDYQQKSITAVLIYTSVLKEILGSAQAIFWMTLTREIGMYLKIRRLSFDFRTKIA